MANTGKTAYGGTVVEVRRKGEDDSSWKKFVCNEDAIPILFGKRDLITCTPLETEIEEAELGTIKFDDVTFTYAWTQSGTSDADAVVQDGFNNKVEIEARLTIDNATDAETTGTTYIIPFKVSAYKHLGEKGGIWKTETTWRQNGLPTETAAA